MDNNIKFPRGAKVLNVRDGKTYTVCLHDNESVVHVYEKLGSWIHPSHLRLVVGAK